MADMELVIKIPEGLKKDFESEQWTALSCMEMKDALMNGTPLEEIPNPCIECSQNCCVCELNGEKCECQKVYVVKENKQ